MNVCKAIFCLHELMKCQVQYFLQCLMGQQFLNLVTSVIKFGVFDTISEQIYGTEKGKGTIFIQSCKESLWMGNRFQNRVSFLFHFRKNIFNFCATLDKSNLNEILHKNAMFLAAIFISFCVLVVSSDAEENKHSMNVWNSEMGVNVVSEPC